MANPIPVTADGSGPAGAIPIDLYGAGGGEEVDWSDVNEPHITLRSRDQLNLQGVNGIALIAQQGSVSLMSTNSISLYTGDEITFTSSAGTITLTEIIEAIAAM